MEFSEAEEPPKPTKKAMNSHRLMNGGGDTPPLLSSSFEIRLFYVRISPCVVDAVPSLLTLSHLRRETGAAIEINGSRIPPVETASIALRRDRIDKGAAEVTYVSTDSVRVSGTIDFEVYDSNELMLCGSLERVDAPHGDSKTGWNLNCYAAVAMRSSAFFHLKLGISSPSIEVYIAGCCSGSPLILTKMIQVSPRRKNPRHAKLDAIPEDEVTDGGEEEWKSVNGYLCRQPVEVQEGDIDGYDSEGKLGHDFYSESRYLDDDGQLTWFNAGVRVGVGIGLGMCVGIGIGVGLLMRSYQATTRTFKRRFF